MVYGNCRRFYGSSFPLNSIYIGKVAQLYVVLRLTSLIVCYMNLLSLIAGVFGLLGGDKDAEGNHVFLGDQQEDGYVESTEQYTNLGGALDNLGRKITGSGLTRAEQQANAFTAQREDIAWQRQMEASNTAYQRQVADMQAAGINPMLAVSGSGGAAVPSAPVHGSVSPTGGSLNLGSIISAIVGIKQAKADIALKNAEAKKVESETQGINLNNEILSLTKDAKVESENLRAELNRKNSAMIDKQLDEIDAHINSLRESAKSEESKRDLNIASSILARMNAYTAVSLLPFEKAYKAAATQNQREAATLAAAHALYQNKLIDEGYIDAIIDKAKNEASSAESRSELDAIKAAIRTGDYSKVKHVYGLASDALSVVSILLDNFNPLNGLIGGK